MTHPLAPAGRDTPIRVLVVDDSAVQRSALAALLEADPEIEVIGWAANGADALRKTAALKPDVVTINLHMPVMDGLETTRRIMQDTPTPIVIVTAGLPHDSRHVAIAAVQAGAVAIAAAPLPGTPNAPAGAELQRTVKSMARVKVIRRWAPDRLRPPSVRPAPPPATPPSAHSAIAPAVVAIGASTGGPEVLRTILTQLPATFAPPLLVVQHMDADFVTAMVEWLRPQCALPLELAAAHTLLRGPGIHIAPADQHLAVHGRALALTDAPAIRGHRPSATVLFASVARYYGASAVGVLLTGMGDDGASGLSDLKHAGGVTIAQDEASSVVFGMPAAAIKLGIVDYVLPPSEIVPLLMKLAGCDPEGER